MKNKAEHLATASFLAGKKFNQLTPEQMTDYWRLRQAGYLTEVNNEIRETR